MNCNKLLLKNLDEGLQHSLYQLNVFLQVSIFYWEFYFNRINYSNWLHLNREILVPWLILRLRNCSIVKHIHSFLKNFILKAPFIYIPIHLKQKKDSCIPLKIRLKLLYGWIDWQIFCWSTNFIAGWILLIELFKR